MSEFMDKTKEAAGNICRGTKLCASIVAEEAKIRELYYKLGREYYYDLENDVDDISALEDMCSEIKVRLEKLSRMKKRFSRAERMKMCDVCGAVNPYRNLHCGRCGRKL